MTTTHGIKTFTGHGQFGNWSDSSNWANGAAPGIADKALIGVSTSMNGSFTASTIMFLGTEAVTINGTMNSLSTGECNSLMICDHAVVTASSTALVNASGGIVVGLDTVGALIAQSNGTTHSAINGLSMKIGQKAGSLGSVTLDGSVMHLSQHLSVGLVGTGTLALSDAAHVTVGTDMHVGEVKGAIGHLVLSGGSTLAVAGQASIGTHGTGTVAISGGSVLSAGHGVDIVGGSAVTLSAGTMTATPPVGGHAAVQVEAGATLSGNGTVTCVASSQTIPAGITDNGTITATGGALVLNGNVSGSGSIQISANSSVAITGATVGLSTIAFAGSNGSLALSHGSVTDHVSITGFAAGDGILMSGVDAIAWNGTTDVLSLTSAGHVVDNLHLAGSYTAGSFTLTQVSGGALIGLGPVHGIVLHH